MPDISATLAAIDEAIGCHQCGGGLGSSPSDDFCGEACQGMWQARNADVGVSRNARDYYGARQFGSSRALPADRYPYGSGWRRPCSGEPDPSAASVMPVAQPDETSWLVNYWRAWIRG